MVAVILAAMVGLAGRSVAADGDQLRQITGNRGTAGGCSLNTGIAFDGTNLLLSCWNDSNIVAVSPADGSFVAVHAITGIDGGMGALAWDNGRHLLWACQLHSGVGTVNLTTNTFTPAFNSAGCTDGLAYDGNDGTIWTSADASSSTQHYTAAGVLISSSSNSGLLGNCGNSGIAVGGNLLYLANNGCSEIYRVAKDFSSSTLFATFPRRLEDLECDDLTFAGQGKAAIWSIDAYDQVLNAWEIPAGSCSFGGGGTQQTQPTPPPSRTQVSATSPSCGQAVITAAGVIPGLPHQIVVVPSAGGTPKFVDITTNASQNASATITTGGGTFNVFVRMTSNQVTVSNTVILTVAACAVATPTPTPSPTPVRTPAPTPTPTPTQAPIAVLPSTATGGDSGLAIAALAAIAIALAAFGLRKRYSRT